MSGLVRYETGGQVATVTLDSPHNRNALSAQLVTELSARLSEAGADPVVRAVVLTHAGRVFCSGADLAAAGTGSIGDSGAAIIALLRLIVELPKPAREDALLRVQGIAAGKVRGPAKSGR